MDGYAEDYAYLIFGLLELFQADGDAIWLEWALTLQRRQDELFMDAVDGGWFSTTGRDPSVLLRLKEDYDGAEPAASSVTVLNLLTLSHLTGDATFEQAIERTLGMFAPRIAQSGRTVPMMMAALSTYHAGMSQVVIAGDPASPDTRALTEVVAPPLSAVCGDRSADEPGFGIGDWGFERVARAPAAVDDRDARGGGAACRLCLSRLHVPGAGHIPRRAGWRHNASAGLIGVGRAVHDRGFVTTSSAFTARRAKQWRRRHVSPSTVAPCSIRRSTISARRAPTAASSGVSD